MSDQGAPVLIVGDETAAKVATEAQMRQTARQFGMGRGGAGTLPSAPQPPDTGFVGRPDQVFTLPEFPREQPGLVYDIAPGTLHHIASPPIAETYLLLTTGGIRGAKAVKMQGSSKAAAWPVSNEAADAIGQLLEAFGVRVVDLRDDTDDDQGDPPDADHT